jgi:hypothetical protein
MKSGALTLGAYRLKFLFPVGVFSLLFSMKCPSLSHFINVSLKSTLLDVSIATHACFQGPLIW